jgi:glutathione peroxidase
MKTLIALCSLVLVLAARAETKSIYDIPLKDIDGKEATLKPHQGKVMLVVNVASKCGNTPQYKQLEEVYQKYKAQGLVVAGFPCNQFGKQEPGTSAEIKEFCSSKYHVTFPMFDKIDVNGDAAHPLYRSLKAAGGTDKVAWNFEKFLVGRDGKVLKRIAAKTKPDAPEVIKAIEEALAAK